MSVLRSLIGCTVVKNAGICSTLNRLKSVVRPRSEVQPPNGQTELPDRICDKMPKRRVIITDCDLASYADRSPVLQKLIDLGVEIHKFSNNPVLMKYILSLNYERDILPYLEFLKNNGVSEEGLSRFITKNPYIFKFYLEDLEVRITYLESKKFTKDMISRIVTGNPMWLSLEVKAVDGRLGFVQKSLELNGKETRQLVVAFPKIVSIPEQVLHMNLFTFKEELGLDKHDCKEFVLKMPGILRRDNEMIISTFHVLHRVMSIPIHLIISQPKVLTYRSHLLLQRHKFLLKLGRAQYNPNLPGYVSLSDMINLNHDTFCKNVALTSADTFYQFLKTL